MNRNQISNHFASIAKGGWRCFVSPQYWLHTIGIVSLSIVLFLWCNYNFTGISDFSPLNGSRDIHITDFYNTVANKRPITVLDSSVVVVSIDGCSRSEIIRTLNDLDYCSAAVVGLDVFFPYHSVEDEALVGAITACDNLVLPQALDYNPKTQRATITDISFFEERTQQKPRGAVNLAAENAMSVIRTFAPYFITPEGDSIPAFAVALVNQFSADKITSLKRRKSEREFIYYPSIHFDVISASEVLEMANNIKNKIVIVGNVEDPGDVHITPINAQMSGTLVHAYIAATLLHDRYIAPANQIAVWAWAIATLVVLIFVNVVFICRSLLAGNTLMRIVQFGLIWLCVWMGYRAFVFHRVYWDFSFVLLFAFGLLASDLWFTFIVIYRKISLLWKRK